MVTKYSSLFSFHRLIRGHRKFAWARDWLKERMPKLEDQIEMAAVPILCCIAENAWDIKEIFNVLFQPSFNVWITPYSKCSNLTSNIEIFVDFWIGIYLHFAIWMGQIQSKLINMFVTYELASL